MKFQCLIGTDDKRLTKGKVYQGNLVWAVKPCVKREAYYPPPALRGAEGLRIAVFDNRNEWMTFDPKCFQPIGG